MLNIDSLNKHILYINALQKIIQNYDEKQSYEINDIAKKIALYGVKIANSRVIPLDLDDIQLEKALEFLNSIQTIMEFLTPRDFINLFPIEKEYHKEALKPKDYFHTKRYLQTLDMDKPIGAKINDFLINYHNWQIYSFILNSMEILTRQKSFKIMINHIY